MANYKNDITPALVDAIMKDFEDGMEKNRICEAAYNRIRDGTGDFKDADVFAEEAGKVLSDAIRKNVKKEDLPDGKMYYNIAEKIILTGAGRNFDIVSKVAVTAQEILNEAVGIGVKAKAPERNNSRLKNLIKKISGYETYDKAEWLMGEPIVNISKAIVIDTIKVNADFHKELGISAKITRHEAGKSCEYCRALIGTFEYGKQPKNFFTQHEFCRCYIEYKPVKGKTISYTKIKGQKMKEV